MGASREAEGIGVVTGESLGFPEYGALAVVEASGVGSVYETFDQVHRRAVLVRIGHGAEVESLRRAFERWREVGTHPNVLTVYDLKLSRDGRSAALETERCHDVLADRLAGGPLPFVEVLALGHGLASALAELHRSGQVHGSIDASAVHLSHDGRPALADIGFGEAGPTAAGFDSDVSSLADVLLEAIEGRPHGGASERGSSQWGAAGDVPVDVSNLLVAARAGSAAPTADELRSALAELCGRYIGHVPESLSGWSWGASEEASDHTAEPIGDASRSGPTDTFGHAEPTGEGPTATGSVREARRDSDATVTAGAAESDQDAPSEPTDSTGPHPRRRMLGVVAAGFGAAALAFVVVLAYNLLPSRVDDAGGGTEDDPPATTLPPPSPPERASGGTDVVVTPNAPEAPEIVFLDQGVAGISWQHDSSATQAYLLEFAEYETSEDQTGRRRAADEPLRTGWIDANGLHDGPMGALDELDLLTTTRVDIEVDLSRIWCFRAVAWSAGAGSSSGGDSCIPEAPGPNAPTVAYDLQAPQPLQLDPTGRASIRWTDNSNDESHFKVLVIRPDSPGSIAEFVSADADSVSVSVQLDPGKVCMVVRAENARNRILEPIGRPIPADASTSEPFCFDVGAEL